MLQDSIIIPDSYFLKMAKQDYSNWMSALAREFYQNSIDAKATWINVNFDFQNYLITVQDNGCGMDEYIVRNKLLVLGGSQKNDVSVGAFGKAKELLYFSWPFYHIRTRNIEVQGAASRYSINYLEQSQKGTKATIKIPESEDIHSIQHYFISVARKNQTKCKIYVDNEYIPFAFHKGKFKGESNWYKVYQNKSHESNIAQFRINGIWMFDRYIGKNHGTIIVELKNNSLEYLTSNRDSLKFSYLQEIDQLISNLQVNQRKLGNNADDVFEKIDGIGDIVVCNNRLEENINYLVDYVEAGEEQELLSFLTRDVSEDKNTKVYSDIINKRYETVKDTIKEAVKNETSFLSKADKCKPLEFIGYQPDFVLKYKGKRTRKIENFMKTNKAVLLAHVWTEIIKQILIDNEIYTRFVAGFVFDEDSYAMHCKKDGQHYILVNPFKIGEKTGINKIMTNRKILVEALKSAACHEIAHIFEEAHNENYVQIENDIRAKTWKSDKIYQKIGKIKL